MNIDIAKMFPEAARRVEILEGLKRSWAGIVGIPLARCSCPCCLGVDELCISVRDSRAVNMLRKMKGNIERALASRWEYNIGKDFALKMIAGMPDQHRHKTKSTERKKKTVQIDDEAVRRYMENAPETLPDDINYSVSHLKAFLDKKFSEKNNFH